VHYRDYWFWIDQADLRTKRALVAVIFFFTLVDTGGNEALPLITSRRNSWAKQTGFPSTNGERCKQAEGGEAFATQGHSLLGQVVDLDQCDARSTS
jgi:hypothetical protein